MLGSAVEGYMGVVSTPLKRKRKLLADVLSSPRGSQWQRLEAWIAQQPPANIGSGSTERKDDNCRRQHVFRTLRPRHTAKNAPRHTARAYSRTRGCRLGWSASATLGSRRNCSACNGTLLLQELFEQMDMTGNGEISLSEFTQCFRLWGRKGALQVAAAVSEAAAGAAAKDALAGAGADAE
jgi:hypothetical protein